MTPEHLDFLVIGGGPGGYAAALHAAHLGRSVTLVDRRGRAGLGGVCLHEGCIPTKALLHLAERAAEFDRFAGAGLVASDATVDLAVFQQWKASLIARLSDGVSRLLDAAGVRVVEGDCRFDSARSVIVDKPGATHSAVTFTSAVIATGSRPVELAQLPTDGETVLDSTAALELTQVPPSLAVVGGGSVGMELGMAFAKLGTRLTLIEQAEQILPMIDPALIRPLRRRLSQLGVDVITGATVTDHDAGEAVVKTATGEQRVPAARILAGVGRRPNTDALGLDAAGITVGDDGFLAPGADRRVLDHVAAIGDVTPGPFHAHKAGAEARVAADVLCSRPGEFSIDSVPFIAHADPEVASVGLTAARAAARGMDVRTAQFPLGGSGWAVTLGAAHGYAHLVVDAATDAIVGVHMVGPHATELIGEGALAIRMGATVADLSSAIHAHPTLSEQLPEAGHVAEGMPVHVARRRS